MIQAIVLAFLAGLMGFNGIPHFVQGITGREFPNLTGNSATNNAVFHVRRGAYWMSSRFGKPLPEA